MVRKNNSHIFTAREKGSAGRLVILIAMTVLIIFSLCSAYAVALQPTNPASWSMLAFFSMAFFLLLIFEDNVFPSLPRNKLLPAVISWLFLWMFVAFFASFLLTMELTQLGIAMLFALILGIDSIFTVTNETQWQNFKAKTGGRVKRAARSSASRVASKIRRKKKIKPKKKKWRLSGW